MADAGATDSRWIKCISTQGNIRGVAIQAGSLVAEMAHAHGLTGDPIRSLGEAVVGALLLASYCKGSERINLNIQGSGNIKQALIDANPDGTVRGYVIERTDKNETEAKMDGPWGAGLLSVLRTKDAEGEQPYIGTVPLATGHLAKDLTFYWVQSEQIPSAVGLAIELKDGKVGAAGGFMVQVLPGASAEEVKAIEKHINEIDSLVKKISDNPDPMILLGQIFQDTAFVVVEEKALRFTCSCSWERVNRALGLVGVKELRAMLEADAGATVNCDFCAKKYHVDKTSLEAMISKLEAR